MKFKPLTLLKRMLFIILAIAGLLFLITIFYIRLPQFGGTPDGARLERMKRSSHYKDGKFHNLSVTPELTEGTTMLGALYEFLFNKSSRVSPTDIIPSVKIDLHAIPVDSNVLVWFGHSSYLIQIDGKRILVDPIFSGNASPIPGTTSAFAGTDRYTVADLPEIDYLFISHDHYDHVDYTTLLELKSKVKTVVCGLGVGAHFERWGYDSAKVQEKDWYDEVKLDSGFVAYSTPARHFSGRSFSRNNTLWTSYVIQTPTLKIYIGGDSGYDSHFAEIGNRFGPFDLAIIENGQYNLRWKYIHTQPEQVLQAAHDLKARRLFPVHSSKFALASHAWDEPLTRVTELNSKSVNPLYMLTPVIGEVVNLNDSTQTFKHWWKGIN
jgi:L-ascorbate metabolism protein UlaG (beta-lactamase superfamily)